MKKEEILKKSREENRKNDPYQTEIQQRASSFSGVVTVLLSTILFIIQKVVDKGFNFGLYAIIFAYSATDILFRYVYLKRRKDLVLGIIYLAITLALLVLHIRQLFSKTEVV